jgi:hypothetical protein
MPSSAQLSSDALQPFAATQPASTPTPVPMREPPAVEPDRPVRGRSGSWVVAALLLVICAGSVIYALLPATARERARAPIEPQPANSVSAEPAVPVKAPEPAVPASTPQVVELPAPAAASEAIVPRARPQAPLRVERATHEDKRVPSRVEKAGLVTHNPFQ